MVILTKNPRVLCDEPYLSVIRSNAMSPLTVQITCAFWNDDVRSFFEPNAPSVASRLEALRCLAENGIDVELRIDPLFPSSRIEETIRRHKPLPCYSIPEAQPLDDIANLVHFVKDSGARAVIAKPLKIPFSRNAERCKDWFAEIYNDAVPGEGRRGRAGSWRLPELYQRVLVSTVADICAQEGIGFKHCMHDVLTRD